MKKIICILFLISQFSFSAWAESFVVRNIEFVGLQHISPATVESYLPIHRGQTLQTKNTASIVRALYRTGFFERITLSRRGNTLIVHLQERAIIGQLKIAGNSVIPTDKLNTVMKSLDIAEGRVYNPAMVEKIKQGLLNQYYQLGRYNARVTISVSPMSRNRVMVNIEISEGLIAKVERISIIGNHAFKESVLVKQLAVTTTGLFTFISQSDRYSEAKLEASVEKLRAFYLDYGYLNFEVVSAQASVSPDKKSVYITIVVKEGEPYTVTDFEVEGNFVYPKEEFVKRITIVPGEIFSRQKIMDSQKAINEFLGNNGYLFATVQLRPKVNEKNHTVMLVFEVVPGRRTYIRHITFSENMRTNDNVLRREVVQMEAAPASTVRLDESKHRLSLLPYIKDVEMSVQPVLESDQVDVNYKLKEDNSAQVSAKVGYSQAYGVLLGGGFNQKNFFGTGNSLGINFNRSKYEQFYSVDYTDPYFTEDGISQTISASIATTDPGSVAKLNNSYTTNEYDFGVIYSIPIGQEMGAFNRIIAGAIYQNTLILLNQSRPQNISNQIKQFITRHGRRFQEIDLRLGYSRDSRDRAIFPTRGGMHSAFADIYSPIGHGSLSFYTLNYHGIWYQPLYNQFILLSRADLGYGNGFHGASEFPFFRNYYAGGIDSVRGYQTFTLGPLDSLGQAYGGNILLDASIGLIFPNYISDNLRTVAFFDAGNVYSAINNRTFGGLSTNSGPIRYSAGIEVDWLMPFGPIRLSLSKPINLRRPPDKDEPFQFALGANF